MSLQTFPSAVRGLGYTVTKSPEDSVLKQRSPSFAETRIIQSQNPLWHWSLVYDFLTDNQLKPNPAYAYTDLQTMMGFITSRQNSYDDFLFSDPDDNSFGPGLITTPWLPNFPYAFGAVVLLGGHAVQVVSAPAGARSGPVAPAVSTTFTDGKLTWQDLGVSTGYPNPQAQLQLVTDGTNWFSPLQINRGGWNFYEDVTDLDGSITVYDNGTVTTNYTLGFQGLSFSGFSCAGLYLAFGYAPVGPITATFNYFYRVRFEEDTEDFEKWANQWWAMGGDQGSRGRGELKLITSRLPSSSLVAPAPPIPLTAGAAHRIIIYPTQVSLFQRSDIGFAVGNTSWAQLELITVGLGSPKPQADFFGFVLPPTVPPSAVKGVYAYAAFSGVSLTGYDAGIQATLIDSGGGAGGFNRFNSLTKWATLWNSHNIYFPAFIYSSVHLISTFGASIIGQNLQDFFTTTSPCLVIDY